MKELSLFTGTGGGIWGSRLLGWETIGYVEKSRYCRQTIEAPIRDGWFHRAPVFGDIDAFLRDGYARSYQGLVDIISAGFPCQPFSIAGKKRRGGDSRNKWPETIECIRQVGCPIAWLENVPELAGCDYFARILGDLASAGFDAEWGFVPACCVGSRHIRERLWILAVSSNALSERRGKLNVPAIAADQTQGSMRNHDFIRSRDWTRYAWSICEPGVVGMADDVADRCNRIRAAGNGQVSLAMVRAWQMLTERFGLSL